MTHKCSWKGFGVGKNKIKMASSTEQSKLSSGIGAMEDWRKKTGLSCCFFFFATLNLGMVFVGGNAIDHKLCPVEPMVPIYLIGKYSPFRKSKGDFFV